MICPLSPETTLRANKIILAAFAISAVKGAILVKEVIKHKMKLVAFLTCTTLFLILIISAGAQESNSVAGFRAGHYSGTAFNTTANQRGKVVFDLYDFDPRSGHVRAYFAASDGLEGEAWLTGRIDKSGALHLTGSLAQFKMEVEARLTSANSIKANYSLAATNSQAGNFEVTLQRPFDTSTSNGAAVQLVGAWEVGGGMAAPTNPVTGMASGMSFVDARRFEILPGGEFTHLHSHENCRVTGIARCCLQTATMERGTIDINGNQMILHINGGDNLARDNCNPRLNQQSHVSPKVETFSWTIRRGTDGNSQLCIQGGSENTSTCYNRQS